MATALENTGLESGAAEFATILVNGVLEHINELDRILGELSVGWELQRQPAVDRNILRMAGYEIMYLDYVPPSVSINEAVELAKKFSTEESGRFVNGVLGALARRYSPGEDEHASSDT